MTGLQRTGLTTSRKIQCAAAAVTGQQAPGSKTAISEAYERSRPTVHAVGAAESVLRAHFEAPLLGGTAVDVRVDDAQRRRAVVALRVLAPNALRPIEDLVALLCANLDTQAISDGDKREGVRSSWQKVKIDRQIVATAQIARCERIITGDPDVEKIAGRAAIETTFVRNSICRRRIRKSTCNSLEETNHLSIESCVHAPTASGSSVVDSHTSGSVSGRPAARAFRYARQRSRER